MTPEPPPPPPASPAPLPAASPAPRLGPRPLAYHLTLVLAILLSSGHAWPGLRLGWPLWRPGVRDRASALAEQVAAVTTPADQQALLTALERETRRRLDAILRGIERYRRHPYRRALAEPPVAWQEGASRLLDYRPQGGLPVLFVPSLVNRYYILDLSARRSLVRTLAERGLRPLVIDWGTPGPLERRYTLTDYIAGRLERALGAALALVGRPLAAVGYCMGGLLATALAQRQPQAVSALVVMATPWDFQAEDGATAERAAAALAPFGPALEAWGELPVDALQLLFAQLDPWLIARKFSQFGRMDQGSSGAHAFVALEDWLNDGVALPAAVARECLQGWYGRNEPARGQWLVAGQPVLPQTLSQPSLALIPERDRIVPPASATALAQALPRGTILRPPLGHIGMVTSSGADAAVTQPLATWLLAQS